VETDERWIPDDDPSEAWFAVRQVVLHHDTTYEERITIWKAPTFDEAVQMAEVEGAEYARIVEAVLLGLSQACRLGEYPANGTEVFSLMRDSELAPNDYLDHFFDTGSERQGIVGG
jgi:hypothetical protein